MEKKWSFCIAITSQILTLTLYPHLDIHNVYIFLEINIQNIFFFSKICSIKTFIVILQRQNPPRLFAMRTRAGLFYYIDLMTYTKLPISIAEQIALLKSRGLTFADEPNASKRLEHISYYRFAAYLRPMESDKVTH